MTIDVIPTLIRHVLCKAEKLMKIPLNKLGFLPVKKLGYLL